MTINKAFTALGNNRPEILIRIEDCILKAIIALLEGRSRENTMDDLYSKILTMEKDLANDNDALTWFDFSTAPSAIPSTPSPPQFLPTPAACECLSCLLFVYLMFNAAFPNVLKDIFLGQCSLLKTPLESNFSYHIRACFPSGNSQRCCWVTHCHPKGPNFTLSICKPPGHSGPDGFF